MSYTVVLSGCLSPIALNRAVISYDKAVSTADSKQLLLNIARAQHHEPVHFTQVSNIAATFDFRFSAGGTPALTGDSGGMILPTFGGSVAENPTISIVPIAGEEFTQRLLTPFHQSKFTLLLRQHYDVDLMLRMLAQEVRLQNPKFPAQEIPYRNNPLDRTEYEMFRRVVLHLSAIQDQGKLYAERVTFNREWTIPAGSVSAEGFQALQKEYKVQHNRIEETYTLRKQVLGQILITNYDPILLSREDRVVLQGLSQPWVGNDVVFDIRSGYVGGEWPLRGVFFLRSFHSILNFLGRSIDEVKEYDVDKDPRTPPIIKEENPSTTMEIIASDIPSSKGTDLSIRSHGKYYSVKATGPSKRWNLNAFQLLNILFRMTITDAPQTGVPSITISK